MSSDSQHPSESSIIRHMVDGYARHEIVTDENGIPVDYRFLDLNPAFERITGLGRDIIGRTVRDVLPGTEREWIEKYGRVALTGEPLSFENHSSELKKHFKVNAYSPEPGQFVCLFIDISERVVMEQKLRRSEAQLQALLDHSRDLYLILDRDLCVLEFNSATWNYMKKLLDVSLTPGICLPESVSEETGNEW